MFLIFREGSAEGILSSGKKTQGANLIHPESMGIATDHLTLPIDNGYSSWVFYNSDSYLNFDLSKFIVHI